MQRFIVLRRKLVIEGVMTEPKSSKQQQVYYLAIAAVVVVILIAVWLLFGKEQVAETPVNLMPPVEILPQPTEMLEPEPLLEPDLTEPKTDTVINTVEPEIVAEVVKEPEVDTIIPTLDDSDPEVKERLLALNWQPGLAALFVTEDMLRNFTVQVDNIAQGQLVKGFPVLQPLEEKFSVADNAKMQLDDTSFARYTPYVQLLDSVPPEQLLKLFNRYEPLLQQAYAELGYPDKLFKSRVVDAIDELLATPELEYPLELTRSSVMYEFADPAIEQLPAAQKQLLRLGPAHQKTVKKRLQQYKTLLLKPL